LSPARLDELGACGLFTVCRQHKVVIRGDLDNVRKTLLKKIHGARYQRSPAEIVAKSFIEFFLYKLGSCHLLGRCLNEYDFYTSATLTNIPKCYLFCTETNGVVYGYDIRSLYTYRSHKNATFRNPYTEQEFTQSDIDRMDRKLKWLQRFGYSNGFVTSTAPAAVSADQFAVNVFSQITKHQYVDYRWFSELDFEALKRLYHELYEIWHYRLPMQSSYKAEMTKDGHVFANWDAVKYYQESMHHKLQLELLQNIEKLVTGGITADHRATGCYIFMLGLVLVSESAQTSYPELFQAAYYGDE